jgi:two-component system, OmpR family, phosphate regulon response regulator PhoB
MTTAKILVVEDEPAVREMIRFILTQDGFTVAEAEDARQAESQFAREPPHLILLDWMLPGSSGITLAKELRRRRDTRDIPIIMLTARAEEEDKVRGFESGIDDYITKPFSPRELLARIRANLRRAAPHRMEDSLEMAGLVLNPTSHRVTVHQVTVDIGPTEFRLLHFLMSHADRVYSRIQLLDQVWGINVYIEERTVDVHIRRLRKALEAYGCDGLIQTVRGSGYRFSARA